MEEFIYKNNKIPIHLETWVFSLDEGFTLIKRKEEKDMGNSKEYTDVKFIGVDSDNEYVEKVALNVLTDADTVVDDDVIDWAYKEYWYIFKTILLAVDLRTGHVRVV